MPSARQLRKLADQAERDRAKFQAAADASASQRDELRKLAAMVERSALPGTLHGSSIVSGNMQLETAPKTTKLRIAAGRTKRDHVAKRAFLEAGKTDADIAAEVGVSRATVSAWMADDGDDGLRGIPRSIADRFLRKYKIPLSAWARIAD